MRYLIAGALLFACGVAYADVTVYGPDGSISTIVDNGSGSATIYTNDGEAPSMVTY